MMENITWDRPNPFQVLNVVMSSGNEVKRKESDDKRRNKRRMEEKKSKEDILFCPRVISNSESGRS